MCAVEWDNANARGYIVLPIASFAGAGILSSSLNLLWIDSSSLSGDKARRDVGNGASFFGFLVTARLFCGRGVWDGGTFLQLTAKRFGEVMPTVVPVKEGNWICSISFDDSARKKTDQPNHVSGGEGLQSDGGERSPHDDVGVMASRAF